MFDDSRRTLVAKSSAALFGLTTAQSASAKAGQFGKQTIFDLVGTPAISSPYQPGGPKAGKDATYGYAKSDGPVLADGYENDVTREKAPSSSQSSASRAWDPRSSPRRGGLSVTSSA